MLATYGKDDQRCGVWCPRKYEDKRFVILTAFPSFMDKILEFAPIETTKYTVSVFGASVVDKMNLNTDVQANKHDINAEGRMKISKDMAEEMLKSWNVAKADFAAKRASLTRCKSQILKYITNLIDFISI